MTKDFHLNVDGCRRDALKSAFLKNSAIKNILKYTYINKYIIKNVDKLNIKDRIVSCWTNPKSSDIT